ncbi:hypothetical protein APTSU1_001828700 [Apodemus speciosus]|uniref:Uncharacterized protein n=1 Tax=Apodemus speciosus TaxID=105296 RepID=A0ABQ0FUW9_APOSI
MRQSGVKKTKIQFIGFQYYVLKDRKTCSRNCGL